MARAMPTSVAGVAESCKDSQWVNSSRSRQWLSAYRFDDLRREMVPRVKDIPFCGISNFDRLAEDRSSCCGKYEGKRKELHLGTGSEE